MVHSKENEIQAYLKQHACPKKFAISGGAPPLCVQFLVRLDGVCTKLVHLKRCPVHATYGSLGIWLKKKRAIYFCSL
jgi:hypothetical protein